MRALALAALLLAAPQARAASQARWEEVLLLDWVYPGEQSYQALKAAAAEAGASNWVAQRLQRGEKIPQASARELAYALMQDPRVSPQNREALKAGLSDESELLKETGERDYASRAREIAAQFDDMSRKMDEIDEIYKMNNYGKGNVPSASLTVWSGYRMETGYGMMNGWMENGMLGGLAVSLEGTLDKATYTLSIGGSFSRSDDDWLDSRRQMGSGVGFSFVLPIGSGGVEVSMGRVEPLNFSHLFISSPSPLARDLFSVNFADNYRGAKEIKELDLGYPSGGREQKGVYLRRQGASPWWPFTNTQLTYAPVISFWETYEANKMSVLGLRLDEELGPRFDVFDNIILYATGGWVGTDADTIRGIPSVHSSLIKDAQTSLAYVGGVKMQLSYGSALDFEYGISNYTREPTVPTATRKIFSYADSAHIATLIQPVGPFNLALETGMAGRDFITGIVGSSAGSTFDSTWTKPNAIVSNPNPPDNYGLYTLIQEPAVLVSNTQRFVGKLQWTGAWLSFGVYDGLVSQLEPTGPLVRTSPYIEGRTWNGYGWFRMFGQAYGDPPAPGTVPAYNSSGSGQYFQGKYNKPTNNPARYGPGAATVPWNWHEIAQRGYREAQFTVTLSEKGLKDNKFMPDSLKALNYAGGTAKIDFKSMLTRTLPFEVVLTGEVRDVAAQAGIPALDDSHYFNQQVSTGYLVFGLTDKIDLLGMGGYETWKTRQSYFPLFAQITELGIGSDFNLDPFLTGLKVNIRSTWLYHEDLMNAGREFSFWTLGLGTFLTY